MTDENRAKAHEIVELLRERYPDVKVSLDFDTPFQLLVATILAAQCTDAKVNQVTPELFRRYPRPIDFANTDIEDIQEAIHATGFFRQKARAIVEASQDIVNVYGGEVPDTMEELLKLRGVGRKTANVLLGAAFGKPAVIVDTHVLRITGRLGLVDARLAEKKDAEKVEQRLWEILPPEDTALFCNLLVFFGRDICTAKKPRHVVCPLLHLCPTGQRELSV